MSSLTPEEEKVLNTNPRSVIVAGLIIIVLFFGGLAAWSAFLPFYGAVIVPGVVKVSENKKIVQHLEGGIVDKIFVREGDSVEKGQLLIRLQGAKIRASVALNQGQLWAKLALAARLQAESRLRDTISWPAELQRVKNRKEASDAIAKELEVFTSKRRDLLGKIALYESQSEQLEKQRQGAQAELKAQEEILVVLEEEITAKEDLLKDKYIDKAQVLELKRQLSTTRGRSGSLEQTIAENSQHIEEFKLRIVALRNTYRDDAVSELSQVSDAIFQIREQLRPMLDAEARLDIVAPIGGVVINLQVHPESSTVIRSGDPLLEIVPEGAQLIVEARLQSDEITKVHKGQRTEVTLSAFDRRTTPRIPGVVDYVSADQVTQDTPQGQFSFYMVHVVVDPQELEKAGAYLYPGMPAVCYITTDRRTILSYLLEPFLKMTDDALREG